MKRSRSLFNRVAISEESPIVHTLSSQNPRRDPKLIHANAGRFQVELPIFHVVFIVSQFQK